jgi:hypothetical protein
MPLASMVAFGTWQKGNTKQTLPKSRTPNRRCQNHDLRGQVNFVPLHPGNIIIGVFLLGVSATTRGIMYDSDIVEGRVTLCPVS